MKRDKKINLILAIAAAIFVFIMVTGIISLFSGGTKSEPNPQLDPNYKGVYDESSGKLKVTELFEGKTVMIDDCTFSDLKFSSSPNSSSFYGKFVSNNSSKVGKVNIKFILYDKDKKIVKEFYNHLKDVKAGNETVVYGQWSENIDNVEYLDIIVE